MARSLLRLVQAFLLASTVTAQMSQMTQNMTISNVTTSDCPQKGGAHLIVARASTEQLGYGIIGLVKDEVLARIPGSTAEFVFYPATLQDYFNSETQGVLAMRQLINAFLTKCPGLPAVVMGYSQGAQVTADALIGQNVTNFPKNATYPSSLYEPLPQSSLNRVAAVIMMGDPTFVTNETSIHQGNATKNAIFPRANSQLFTTTGLAAKTQSYCDDRDFYCASGDSRIVHATYTLRYNTSATEFVVSKVKEWYANSTNTSGGGSNGSTGSIGSTNTPTQNAASTVQATMSLTVAVAALLFVCL